MGKQQQILSVVVSSLCCCSTCNQASLTLSENFSKKKGIASALVIESSLCYYKTCGWGYAGLENFAPLMNFQRPMSQNSYKKL